MLVYLGVGYSLRICLSGPGLLTQDFACIHLHANFKMSPYGEALPFLRVEREEGSEWEQGSLCKMRKDCFNE